MAEKSICTVDDCSNAVFSKQLCRKHYMRIYRNNSLEIKEKAAVPDKCTLEGCTKPHHASGLCRMHYYRKKRYGDPSIYQQTYNERNNHCNIPGCLNKVKAKNMCEKHYTRWLRNGSPV